MNDVQRRAMEFIATANRGGYRPTGREVNQWRLQPDPKPPRKGKLLKPEVPGTPDQKVLKRAGALSTLLAQNLGQVGGAWNTALAKQFSDAWNPALAQLRDAARFSISGLDPSILRNAVNFLGDEYEVIPGKPGKPAEYAPDKPAEKFLAHLRRLGWIERDSRGGYGVTLLGQALLRAEASVDSDDQNSPVVVLEADDELAYGHVLGVIAECGDAFIMDAYLGTDELVHILKYTNASRFLVGDKLPKSRLTQLAILIELTPLHEGGAVRELRRASFHDRWVIGEQKVYGLGASLNGVGGQSTTTLVEMPDEAARPIRAKAEDLWDNGEVISRTRREDDDAEEGRAATGDDDSPAVLIIEQEDGTFRHDGCDVRHRTREAAVRCKKGS